MDGQEWRQPGPFSSRFSPCMTAASAPSPQRGGRQGWGGRGHGCWLPSSSPPPQPSPISGGGRKPPSAGAEHCMTLGQLRPGLTSHQCVDIVHQWWQFFPFNTRLSPVLKLLCHPLVGGDEAGMIFRQIDTEMLTDEEDQPGESRIFGERDFEWSAEQSWHVKRGVHPPELIQSVSMDTGTRAMRIASVERVFGRERLTHLGIQRYQFIERCEVWLLVGIVAHANEVQQDAFERRVPRTLPL